MPDVHCAEDREDLRMFEEGVSSPRASHAAWAAAASSLQMRHALPEVRCYLPPAISCFACRYYVLAFSYKYPAFVVQTVMSFTSTHP
jgi:hypothetical protein